jgi:hypothetical protein
MKTTILTVLLAALMAGIIFGATRDDPPTVPSQARPELLRETQATARDQLSAKAEQLALNARNAYWQGNYRASAGFYHMLVKSGRAGCNDLYNLACCYGRLGDAKQAAKYLCLSSENGFDNAEHIRNDPDFQSVRDAPMFKKALEKLERRVGELGAKEGGDREAAGPSPDNGLTASAEQSGETGSSATVSYRQAD